MRLTVNGEIKIIKTDLDSITLDLVLKKLNYQTQLIVVEFNGLIIEPQKWATQKVTDEDKLEIVTIVGGGSYS